MTTSYPVHYSVETPPKFSRVQLLVRILAFCALGILGVSFGAVFSVLFLALPAYAASRLGTRRADPTKYSTEDGPRVLTVIAWFAAVAAWAGLTAEHLPTRTPDEAVKLSLEGTPHQTPGSALLRVITGLPSAFVLAFLCSIGVFVWLWAAFTVLVGERVGSGAFRYLVGLQRWSIRLLAYQASLVDEYPPFSFSDSALPVPTVAITV